MRKHRLLRIIGIIVSIVAAAAGAGILAVAIHPQLAVGGIQKLMYQKNPVNTYAPLHEPSEGTTESGLYKITDREYGLSCNSRRQFVRRDACL